MAGEMLGDSPKVRDFESSDPTRRDWRLEGTEPQFIRIDAKHGESLAVPVSFPGAVEVWRSNIRLADLPRDRQRNALILERLRYEVYAPPEAFRNREPLRLQARLLLKNKDGIWFEALGRRLAENGEGWAPATALHPGWNAIEVDLSEESADCRPRGHTMAWSRFMLSQITSLGISFQGDRPWQGTLALDNIATWQARDDSFPPLRFVDFCAPRAVPQYGLAELSFAINRPLLNPFSSREIAIDARFIPPEGGEEVIVPAFYWQDYEYQPSSGALAGGYSERLVGKGPACFKVRFTPRRPGKWTYILRASYR
ncbi:MAG: DUF5060 domain-containing protein, partial [Planctomycetota bacterium]|nr:DUF5060 domain-containing protein [Planctomycetota bacterium]